MSGRDEFSVEELKCPECKETSNSGNWQECEVGCELCGSHSALRCPLCGEEFDHVWGYKKIESENNL